MYTKLFWKDFFERLVSTLVQVSLGLLGAEGISQVTDLTGINWQAAIVTILIAGLGVLGKCLAAAQKSNTVSPASFAPAAPDKPAVAVDEEEVPDRYIGKHEL